MYKKESFMNLVREKTRAPARGTSYKKRWMFSENNQSRLNCHQSKTGGSEDRLSGFFI
jgi:hypothetical protein